MSSILGLDETKAKLRSYGHYLDQRLAEAVEQGARDFQADLVATAPVKDGDVRAALASPDGLRIRNGGKASVRAEVGFLTSAQKRQAFYAFFVEFGTKGYVRGQKRFAGKYKRSGRSRWTKVRRNIPPRPAHPFFRPAYVALKRNMERLRQEAHALALYDMMRGR